MPSTTRIAFVLGAAAIVAQAVPFPTFPGNPEVRREPTWDSPRTRELAVRACFDCHSNETKWPWYSHVAPAKWIVRHHVEEARHELNFSEFDRPQDEAKEAAKMVRQGEMPLPGYLWLHDSAGLTEAERAELVAGLVRTLGEEEEKEGAH